MGNSEGFSLAVNRAGHTAVGVANTTDGDGISLNILRQGHTAVACVTQVVDVGAGHFAHQGDLPDGIHVGALLGGADGGDGQAAQAVGIGHKAPDVFQRDAGNGSRGGQQDDVRAGGGKGGDLLGAVLEQGVRKTLCRLFADAGQACELLGEQVERLDA